MQCHVQGDSELKTEQLQSSTLYTTQNKTTVQNQYIGNKTFFLMYKTRLLICLYKRQKGKKTISV